MSILYLPPGQPGQVSHLGFPKFICELNHLNLSRHRRPPPAVLIVGSIRRHRISTLTFTSPKFVGESTENTKNLIRFLFHKEKAYQAGKVHSLVS